MDRRSFGQGIVNNNSTISSSSSFSEEQQGRNVENSFHVIHKVPVADTPYGKAKHMQLVEKDPERAIPMFWAAINAGDRVDSALKDMAIVMKQQNRTEEAIEAIKSLRHKCSEQSQEGLDNILLDLYKRCDRLDDQISLLQHKLSLISMGKAFNGRLTKTARSQGKKFQVSIQQEATRLLGNLGWAYMQKLDYLAAESSYRQALAFEPDDNKICNLVICLLHQDKVEEARSYMQRVKPARADVNDSHLKSYERAKEMFTELESNPNLNIKIQAENTNTQIINVVDDENTNINIIPAPTQAPLGFPLKPKPQLQVEQQNPLRPKNFRASPKENVNPNVSYGSSVTVFKNAVPFYPENENMSVPFYPKNENIVKPFVPRNQNMVRPFMPIEEKAPLRVANGGNGMAFNGSMAMGMQTYAGHNNLMGMGKSAFPVEQPERSPFSNLQRLPFSDISGVHYQQKNQFPQHVMGNPSRNSLSFGSSLNSTSGIPHMPLMNTGSIGRTSSSIGILDSLFTLTDEKRQALATNDENKHPFSTKHGFGGSDEKKPVLSVSDAKKEGIPVLRETEIVNAGGTSETEEDDSLPNMAQMEEALAFLWASPSDLKKKKIRDGRLPIFREIDPNSPTGN